MSDDANDLNFAVKAVDGALKLRILGAPYGVDRVGHEFHAGTDFGDLPIVPVITYHGWDELDGKRIAWASKAERDGAGQWYVADLPNDAIGKRLYDDAKAGKVRASSDAIAHLVRPDGALKGFKGRIDRWPIGAISLMGADKYDRAVNPRAIAMPALKAFYDELITTLEGGSGESATKAGRVFASRNSARIAQLRKLIDELQSEMPDAFAEVEEVEGGASTDASQVASVAGNVVNTAASSTDAGVKAMTVGVEAGEIRYRRARCVVGGDTRSDIWIAAVFVCFELCHLINSPPSQFPLPRFGA